MRALPWALLCCPLIQARRLYGIFPGAHASHRRALSHASDAAGAPGEMP